MSRGRLTDLHDSQPAAGKKPGGGLPNFLDRQFCDEVIAAVHVVDTEIVKLDEEELAELNTVGELQDLLQSSEAPPPPSTFSEWPLQPTARFARSLLQHSLVFPVHGLITTKFEVPGKENLQDMELPALIIANHRNNVDNVAIVCAMT